MDAYLVSHNGMGDNLFMIGALHFLKKFYKNIYFLCKEKYYENVKLFFIDIPNITCIAFNSKKEYIEIYNIIKNKYENNDIFVCGLHKKYLKSKITNKKLLNFNIIDNNYLIDYDTITTKNYSFIENFYKDIGLNLTYFYEYYYLPSTKESLELYNSVKDYYIIFIQLKSSDNKSLNISKLIENNINKENTILICNDINLYNIEKKSKDIEKKYEICKNFVYNKLINYNDVIKNSNEIYIIDSCFTGIVLPYLKTKKLKATKVRIIERNMIDNIIL